MRILIHCPTNSGGLAEHVHYQARAFARRGGEVMVLCTADYLHCRPLDYPVSRIYRSLQRPENPKRSWRRALAIPGKVWALLLNQWRLAWEIFVRKPDFVLLDSYAEYLAPLWVLPHVALVKLSGVAYVANLHDPVRDFVVGPRWWHNWSVRLAYAPIKVAVVHQHLADRAVIPKHVAVVEAPVGVYDLQKTNVDTRKVRASWSVDDQSVVFLAFGFIRDNKNVDLLIRAVAEVPCATLVVMGSAQSSSNKPMSYYRDLAGELGVSGRVVFREEFVPDEALSGYFAAADFITITYCKAFHSQSGVLNVAARAKRRVLASAGDSPLKTSVLRFKLGEFVKPDDPDAVARGLKRLCRQAKGEEQAPEPDWQGYAAYASWDSNAAIILEAVKSAPGRG